MKHQPRKRFGQNFLIDESVVAAIIAALRPGRGDLVVEIGPGLGALTRPLLVLVDELHVIEIDRDLAADLQRKHPRLAVHAGDALEFDFAQFGREIRVVGNLPYNISTLLLFHLESCAACIRDIHVMLQQEVVDRIVASPADSDYSRLSVMLRYRFAVEKLFSVGPEAFDPQPQVESAVLRLAPRDPLPWPARNETLFARIVAAAFAQRCKTLRNSLKGYLTAPDFITLDIDPQARGQELSIAQFVAIANHVNARTT